MLPNFFIVGAPKAGTTSLYHYLRKHPQVYMSPVKEPNYFSYPEIVRQELYYKERGIGDFNEYQKLFDSVKNEKAIGEASVSYLFYPEVPLLIKEKVALAKIIILLRNPVDRALSHYYMDNKFRYVSKPFEDILYHRTNGAISKLHYQQYIELGFYFDQVKRYIDTFGKRRVKIFLYEDIQENLEAVVTELFDFLEIEKNFMPDLSKRYNSYEIPKNSIISLLYSQKTLRKIGRKIFQQEKIERVKKILFTHKKLKQIPDETISCMRALFKPDIQNLELLLDRDLSSWYE